MNRIAANYWLRRIAAPTASAVVALFLASAAEPAVFDNLYTVTVERDPSAANPRADAERRAMAVLLTRVTGRQQAATYPELAPLVSSASSLVTSYANLVDNRAQVRFNANEVNRRLQSLNFPIWGEERPSTLLWLAVEFEDGQRAELMAADAAGRSEPGPLVGQASNPLLPDDQAVFDFFAEAALAAAYERGLPLVLPRLDSQDRSLVRFADVWGGFDGFVEIAAERYGADGILIARARMTEIGPELRWTSIVGDRRQALVTQSVRSGIDWLADQYAAEYTVTGGARVTWITVQDVESWQDFGRIWSFLETRSVIDSVDLDSVIGSEYVFRVVTRADDALLERILTLDGSLAAEPADGDFGSQGLVFAPAWRPAVPQ